MSQCHADRTELVFHHPGAVYVVERPVLQAFAVAGQHGVGLEAFPYLRNGDALPGHVTHDGARTADVIVCHVGQDDSPLNVGIEVGQENGVLVLAGCKAQLVVTQERCPEQNVPSG